MTNEDLCRLALAAIDDADARVVLADATEESGWHDERADDLAGVYSPPGWRFIGLPKTTLGCRAIAAVLLFGDWPTSWPLAERCRRKLGYVFPVFPTTSLHDVIEQCIPCPEGQLQRISTANDGLFNDDVLIRVERWPDGDRRIGARCFTVETRITHAAIARSNDVAGILLHECRRLDRAFRDRDEADKVRRT